MEEAKGRLKAGFGSNVVDDIFDMGERDISLRFTDRL